MDKDWSDKNKEFQKLITKKATFKDGIKVLLELRDSLFEQITQIVKGYPKDAFWKMPFAGAEGYHSKTLAYSIWHVFRIEDIVLHTLILNNSQVLERGEWQKKIGAEIITTGNELSGQQIAEFSKTLDVKVLYEYAKAVKESTDEYLKGLDFVSLKKKFSDSDRQRIESCGGVSSDEKAWWLIDYWCTKDVAGLLKMPFSRHWIMHIEAMRKIKNKLCKMARKGVDPVAYCGLSCNHCFLANGVVPAERNITLVLLQPVPQMEFVLTQNAARKKVLTVAGNVQILKAAKRVFILLNVTVQMRLKPRHCL